MAMFDASKEWIVFLPPDIPEVKKAVGDLVRCIGVLATLQETGLQEARGTIASNGATQKTPVIVNAFESAPSGEDAIIIVNSEALGAQQNGFMWRAEPKRVEIHGESGRGLCNGIYSFLSSLGISWPAPKQEKFPSAAIKNPLGSSSRASQGFTLSNSRANEPSRYEGENPAAAPWRRFVFAGKKEIRVFLKRSEAFAAWAARRRYDALVFPLAAFTSISMGRKIREVMKSAGEYGISIEAGGHDLSSLVPRRFFFLHKDYFRMEEGRRKKAHHFCPTCPGTLRLIAREGGKLFQAAGETKVFHLWPDKGAERIWCSCPSCRAFTPVEQNSIAVNAAADVLASINPNASVTCFEKSGERGNVPLRQNIVGMERLPE